jgi:hypothetical protein
MGYNSPPRQRQKNRVLRVAVAGALAIGGYSYYTSHESSLTADSGYEAAGDAVSNQAIAAEHALARDLRCAGGTVPNAHKSACIKIKNELGKIAGAACSGDNTLFCGPKPTIVHKAADGETIAEWKSRAKEITNPNSPLFQQLCASQTGKVWYDSEGVKHIQDNCQGLCAYIQGALWGYSSTGWDTAQIQWEYLEAHGEAHPGNRRPPVGALLFYKTDQDAGHVASYYGNDEIVSSDLMDNGTSAIGHVYIEPAGFLEGERWNLDYEGWALPIEHGGTL